MKGVILIAFILSLILSSCTIVDNEESSGDESKLEIYFVDNKFKADQYVSGIWDRKVLPYFDKKAIELDKVLAVYKDDPEKAGQTFGYREKAEGSPWNFIVAGSGKIVKARTKSRAATMEIDLNPQDGRADATIQIGPVIKGTSIRDSLDFVTFGMFTNQIEYAQLGNALNQKSYSDVLSKFDRAAIVGKTVHFQGAFTQIPYSGKILITPVKLEVR
ncbi:MAG: DUF2291 domain-containing protein [bacterium]